MIGVPSLGGVIARLVVSWAQLKLVSTSVVVLDWDWYVKLTVLRPFRIGDTGKLALKDILSIMNEFCAAWQLGMRVQIFRRVVE